MKHLSTARLLGMASMLQACGGPEEAPRVTLPVIVDPSGLSPVTNDLGYAIELMDARVMVENLSFTMAGEAHVATFRQWISDFVLPSAFAHPGHFQGGEVTGELRGRFQLNWFSPGITTLGTATLLAGTYKSANFTFLRATESDGIASDDPLLGHTAVLRGVATKGTTTIHFRAAIESPEGRALVGAPFQFNVNENTREQLGVRLLCKDPLEGDTLFDGIDFSALDVDGDGQLTINRGATEPPLVDAYNRLRRTLQTHDHFDIRATPAK